MKALLRFSALSLVLAGFAIPVQGGTLTISAANVFTSASASTTSTASVFSTGGTLTLNGPTSVIGGSGGANTILVPPGAGLITTGAGTLTLNGGSGGSGTTIIGIGSPLDLGGNHIILPNLPPGGLHIIGGPGSLLTGGSNPIVVPQGANAVPDSGHSGLLLGIAALGLMAIGGRRKSVAR